MKNTIKIIDLLVKIANGEEVPKKIKYQDNIFVAKGNGINSFVDYVCDDLDYCFTHFINWSNLNDEIEIIEEDNKIEKLDLTKDENGKILGTFATCIDMAMANKINELIDKVNELESRDD